MSERVPVFAMKPRMRNAHRFESQKRPMIGLGGGLAGNAARKGLKLCTTKVREAGFG